MIAVERDAGQALERLSGILVGKATDLVGRHNIGQGVRGTLLIYCPRRADGTAGDNKFVQADGLDGEQGIATRDHPRHNLDCLRAVRVTEVAEHNRLGSDRHGTKHIVAGGTGVGFQIGSLNSHASAGQ